MAKAIVEIGYKSYVLELEQATQLLAIMADGERYQTTGYGVDKVWNIWSDSSAGDHGSVTLRVISDLDYKLGRIAGQPTQK